MLSTAFYVSGMAAGRIPLSPRAMTGIHTVKVFRMRKHEAQYEALVNREGFRPVPVSTAVKDKYLGNNSDKRLSNYLALIVFLLFFVNIYAELAPFVGIPQHVISNVSKVILGILYLTNLHTIVRRMNIRLILFALLSAIAVLLNLFFFEETQGYFLDTVITFYSMCFTTFSVAIVLRDFDALFAALRRTSFIISACMAVLLLSVVTHAVSLYTNSAYSMGLGYSLAFLFLS
jgi:hypothetical protein